MTAKEQAHKWFTQFGHDAGDQIDGMLKSMSFHFGMIGYSALKYWNEVKKELESYE